MLTRDDLPPQALFDEAAWPKEFLGIRSLHEHRGRTRPTEDGGYEARSPVAGSSRLYALTRTVY
jgi:hypothetical protein